MVWHDVALVVVLVALGLMLLRFKSENDFWQRPPRYWFRSKEGRERLIREMRRNHFDDD